MPRMREVARPSESMPVAAHEWGGAVGAWLPWHRGHSVRRYSNASVLWIAPRVGVVPDTLRDDTWPSRRLDRRRCRCGHRSDPPRAAMLSPGPSDQSGYTTHRTVPFDSYGTFQA